VGEGRYSHGTFRNDVMTQMSAALEHVPHEEVAPVGVRAARWACGAAAVFAGIQVGLTLAHLPGWSCPFHALTGLPCPGCGLTRAAVECLHGHWGEAVRWHVMGPGVPVAMVLAAAVAVLPERWSGAVIGKLRGVERRSGMGRIVLVVLLGYWILRLTGLCGLPSS
jgi:hypothetical protein